MIDREARNTLVEMLGDRIRFDIPMSRHTSLRIGGRADAVATPNSATEVCTLLQICRSHAIPHTVLGNGFNILVLDGGIEGVVLLTNKLRLLEERAGGSLRAQAGVSHASIMRLCIQQGLSGLEFAAGIPGSVGGWIAMNAGIGFREARDVVLEVEVVSPTGRKRSHLGRDALRFSYRCLHGLAPGSVIVSALLAVELAEPAAVGAEVRRLLAKRAGSQPLDVPSCGSVFKNPVGNFAGRLIEAAGLKGATCGGAQISTVHANFIANTGGAKAADVLALIREAQEKVERQTGIQLQPEVRILGREAA